MEIVDEVKTRFCPRCERNLPLDCFARAKKRRDGIRAICKDCEGVIGKAKKNALREQVFDKLGHACARCQFSDKRALQIDHVFGGGNQEHSEISNPQKFLRKVLGDTQGLYQILCANCNWIKRAEQREERKAAPFTPEEIEKILQTNHGKPISEDTRKRISEAGKGKPAWNIGVPAWNRGLPRPDALKEKLSQIAIKIHADRSPAERSKLARDRDSKMTPDQRSERARRGAATQAAKSPEEKAETNRKSQATKKANREASYKPSE